MRRFERESPAILRLTIVRRCEPGEEPSDCDLGVVTADGMPVKATPGASRPS